ncbi:MAG: hypothetical protein ACWA5P_11070 [bacterium]
MKKILLPITIIAMLFVGCSSDDDGLYNTPPDSDPGSDDTTSVTVVRITQVNTTTNEVVLSNLGDSAVEVGSYFLCLGPGTYQQVSGSTTESTNLNPNASVTLSYSMNANEDGLGLFATNDFSSTDSDVLLDYIQWGAANQPRVDQAVAAGRWDNVNNFVPLGSPYSFTGSATEFGSNFWEETELPAGEGVLRILSINTANDEITLTNLGGSDLEIGEYWLCLGPGTYERIDAATSASTLLSPTETITISYDIDPSMDGLSIFSTNAFSSSDPDILLDFVQWEAGNQPRAGQAVQAGRWDDINNFITGGSPYNFVGDSDDVGINFWN